MKAKLVAIGNSKGIRLPKSIIEHCGFEGELVLNIEGTSLVLNSVQTARGGWDLEFEKVSTDKREAFSDDELEAWRIEQDWQQR